MKLLIVEEDAVVRRVFAWLAAMDGWEVFPCNRHVDVREVLRRAVGDGCPIDAVLLSYPMFPVDGMELIAYINRLNIPIVLVAASEYAIDRKQAESLGVVRVLIKPPDVFELREVLRVAGSEPDWQSDAGRAECDAARGPNRTGV